MIEITLRMAQGAVVALPAEAWTRLLGALASEPAAQGAAYERVRQRLEAFFRYKGARDPARLGDVVFDRVARKLAEGEALELSNPIPYFLSVARFVWLEACRSDAQARKLQQTPPEPPEEEDPRAREARLVALEQCMEALMGGQRRVIERYHEGQGQARQRARAKLAEDLGISENALRIRAHRIRGALEACVRGKLEDESASGARSGPGAAETGGPGLPGAGTR
jgi:DNA-directed RNA polymerase specialized sigma24 family protein